jgi:hypothetical protein
VRSRWFRPLALLTAAAALTLIAFFLIRGSWWMSATILALWLGAEWYGVWKDQRRRRAHGP